MKKKVDECKEEKNVCFEWLDKYNIQSLKKKAELEISQVEEDLTIYNPETRNLHLLNAGAVIVWNFIDGKNTLESISRKFEELFGDESKNARTDSIRITKCLFEAGLIKSG